MICFKCILMFCFCSQMLAITTDNASSNETFIDHIVHLTKNNSRPFEKERWIRCFAHVINLCVRSALECMFTLIEKVTINDYLQHFQS